MLPRSNAMPPPMIREGSVRGSGGAQQSGLSGPRAKKPRTAGPRGRGGFRWSREGGSQGQRVITALRPGSAVDRAACGLVELSLDPCQGAPRAMRWLSAGESWSRGRVSAGRATGMTGSTAAAERVLQSRFAAPAGGERGAVHAAWQGRYDSPRLGSTRVESDSARQGRMTAVPGPDSGLGLEGGSTKVCRVAEHIQLIPFGRAVPCTIV